MSNNAVFEKRKVCCVSGISSACGIRNLGKYLLPCQRRKKQNNKTRFCCGTLILITQEECHLLVQTIILWLLVCLPGNTVHWVLHKLRAFPLLAAWLCDSQPLHPVVAIPWHLIGGMMQQQQPWSWSQLWCNAVIQQLGYFRFTSEPPRPPVCLRATLPFSQSTAHLSWARQPYMNRHSQKLLETSDAMVWRKVRDATKLKIQFTKNLISELKPKIRL